MTCSATAVLLIGGLVASSPRGSMAPTTRTCGTGAAHTDEPTTGVISDEEMSAAMALHKKTQYFHSDFAHTDFVGLGPASEAPGGAAWEQHRCNELFSCGRLTCRRDAVGRHQRWGS